MQVDYERVHAVADELITFANAIGCGYIKHWKAHSMCVTIVQLANVGADMQGSRLKQYVDNCLKMEGFDEAGCNTLVEWLRSKLIHTGMLV